MRKKIIGLFLFALAVLCVSTPKPVHAANGDTTSAKLRLVLDKHLVSTTPEAAYVNGKPYLPLRSVCEMLGGSVRWDEAAGRALVRYRGDAYPVNGVIVNNRLMVSPEGAAKVFNVNTTYDAALSVVVIDHGSMPSREQLLTILPRYASYNREDLYWMSRIVEAEATGEPYESRLAVASVILNRMRNEAYPDTVREVIFDKKFGVQFTPVSNGSIYNDPSTLSYLAALDALEGSNNAPDALFFMNPQYATSFWMQKNRQYAFTIGGHAYYY